MMRRPAVAWTLAVLALAGCDLTTATSPVGGMDASERVVAVVAAENFWGSIAGQLGGIHVHVTSIITNPNADPHAYEPTTGDARSIATSQMVVLNGIGYDPWAPKLLAADPGPREVLDVGTVLGLKGGANPHRWYNPADVQAVISAILHDYSMLDPADSLYFEAQRIRFNAVALGPYHDLIGQIRQRYAGTPVGASESIFAMLAPTLGLDLITPNPFLKAISEGTDVSSAAKTASDAQIRKRQIRIYVYNSQNTTPDVQVQIDECRAAGIPTARITETLTPASATYQAWQTSQLEGILSALERSGARPQPPGTTR